MLLQFFKITILTLLLASSYFAQQTSFVHQIRYNGKNVYIQNPFASDGLGFCVEKVLVNDQETSDQFASSAFEIDLSNLDLKLGEPVKIEVFHSLNCLPKALNYFMVMRSTFKTKEIKVEKDSLFWCTTDEQSPMIFIVEKYQWNKWLRIGEVDGVGISIENCYSFNLKKHFTNGLNEFRVKQIGYVGNHSKVSPITKIETSKNKIVISKYNTKSKVIDFSDSTFYEAFDHYGNMITKGYNKTLDLSNYKKGSYFINYGTTLREEINTKNKQYKKLPLPCIVLQGRYSGKNVYIQNPFTPDGLRFCVVKVTINETTVDVSTYASAFEIDYKSLGFKIGDSITTKIYHYKDCQLKALNPDYLITLNTISIFSVKIENKTLVWSVKDQKEKQIFSIEQYKWNRWIRIGGTASNTYTKSYQYDFSSKLHSGENKFRIKYVELNGRPKISKAITFTSELEQVQVFKPKKGAKTITFSKHTDYQLYNNSGELIKEGKSDSIDLSDLELGVYYLNYDNTTGEVIKLKP